MDISIFLARAIGLCTLIMGVAILMNCAKFRAVVTEISDSPALYFITGFMLLILGTLLVLSHNFWVSDWRVIITLFAWFILVRGVVRLLFPEMCANYFRKISENIVVLNGLMVFLLILGAFLTYAGFYK